MAQITFSLRALEDLERFDTFLEPDVVAGARATLRIIDCVEILRENPEIGRPVEGELRELVISRGKTGYLALYAYDPVDDVVRILRVRHQREAGYPG